MVKKKSQSKNISLSKPALPGRPPIVAVLGHIDHGKTTLLDYIKKSRVAEKEFGGITQHIGAYQVTVEPSGEILQQVQDDRVAETHTITFIDTPGHEAFAKMRSRGAKVADIAVLVVAGNEGVMPQTKESIKFIKEAKIPMIVALSKIDLPAVFLEKTKKQLAKEGVMVEGYGGDVVTVPISGKTGKGVGELLEMIILVSEMEGLTADPRGNFEGLIIESKMDHQRGPVATILVKNGTLTIGADVTAEGAYGRIKAMFDENARQVLEAPPSKPVEVLGFKEVMAVGSKVLSQTLQILPLEKGLTTPPKLSSCDTALKIILKTDVKGSQEAISENLPKEVAIIKAETGDINESDILLAKTTGAVVIGFNVKVGTTVLKLASEEKVRIKTYEIIYKLLEEIEEVIKAVTAVPVEEIIGQGEVIAKFTVNGQEVAGVKITKGRICRDDKIKIMKGEKEIGEARVKSIHHLKEEIPKAEVGTECGILLSPQLDFSEKDVIISYKQ